MQLVTSKVKADKLFRAFADPTRLRILNLLRPGELCVCDLVRVIGSPQPTISRHLAYLRKVGLVSSRKHGLWMYYTLVPAATDLHEKLIESLACCAVETPAFARDAKRLKKACCDSGTSCESIEP